MQCFAYVGPVTDFNILVTDSSTDPRFIRELQDSGLQVIIAEAGSAKAITHIRPKRIDNRSHTD
jgi:hypothetical protein